MKRITHPEWNVFVENINRSEICVYNIFNHSSFMNDCNKAWDKCKDGEDAFCKFSDAIKRSLQYYFWCKCEWEIILSGFPPSNNFKEKKVDVFQQVMSNWKIFIEYLWNFYADKNNYLIETDN